MAYDPIPQKNEDDASANADAGVVILAIRKATPGNTSGTDGDYETLQVSAGRLWVDASGKALRIADVNDVGLLSAVHALNATGAGVLATQMVAEFDDTSPTAITENQFGNLRMSANRNMYSTIRDAAGNERGANVDASNRLLTAGSLTNNNAAPGANNIGALSALANAAAPTYTEGDQVLESVDLSGNQRVTLGTKLDNTNDSITTYDHGATYANISSSTNVLSGAGHLRGIFVASASATPTIKIWDNTTATTPILVNTFTPVAGTMYTFPNIRVATGIFVTISGTVDCTVFYDNVTS